MFNMALHTLSALCFLLGLVRHFSAGSLYLDVYPAEIAPGLTKALTVNCSFSYAAVTNISSIISLIISKSDTSNNQPSKFTELKSLNVFSPDKIIGLSQINATVTGQIDADSESYLSITWSYPQEKESGLYLCEVHGVDQAGHPVQMSHNALVTSQSSDIEQIVEKVSELQRQVESQETVIENQSNIITKQKALLESLAQNQSVQFDIQESGINTLRDILLSLAHKQSLLFKLQPYFISAEYKGHLYLLFKEDWTYSSEAEETCPKYGGYLAQIADSEENQFVKDFVHSVSNDSNVLVNGTYNEHKDYWTFTNTDQALPYTDWANGEPAQQGRDWTCLVLDGSRQWHMAAYPCDVDLHMYTNQKYLCKVPVSKSETWN